MVRLLLSLAVLVGMCGAAAAQRPLPPVVHYGDACAVYLRPAARPPAELAVSPRLTAAPAPPSRIPSNVIRDYAPNSQAAAAAEQIPVPPRQKPEVQEFRTGVEPSSPGRVRHFDVYTVAAEEGAVVPAAQGGLRPVRFWNLSDHRLTLQLLETTHPLERGQALSFDLPASFQWRITGRELQTTDLGSPAGLEIVIRR